MDEQKAEDLLRQKMQMITRFEAEIIKQQGAMAGIIEVMDWDATRANEILGRNYFREDLREEPQTEAKEA